MSFCNYQVHNLSIYINEITLFLKIRSMNKLAIMIIIKCHYGKKFVVKIWVKKDTLLMKSS
ncbi:hypothetical protein SAMN03080594_1033 [Arenibacter palladensis]|uniref:Uncharacterized protein n=1 Tax=Arenibacter palladensis TaxID=237373 RepID=A0A1M4ZY98_9FLAO|nr:hypothetical protein SAMN03080594_1033 [Arenibacter palladensis]